MNMQLISQNLEYLGKKYEKENLTKWKHSNLNQNENKGLDFLLGHSFARGRRDELSHEYHTFTIKTLSEYYNFNNSDNFYQQLKNDSQKGIFDNSSIKKLRQGKKNSIQHPDFGSLKIRNPLIKQLTEWTKIEIEYTKGNHYLKEICLQNDADLLLVLDILHYMSESEDRTNIYKYLNGLIKDKKIEQAYNELINLSYIGDKIATFILRDIVIMNNYLLAENELKYVFPVDTWVEQVAKIISKETITSNNSDDIKKYFINNFPDSNIPLIAAGIWYLGAKSFKLAVMQLEKYNLDL